MAKKIELLHTTYDESGNIESQEVVHPLTSPDCIIMENGKTLDEVMGDGIATPTLTHEGTSFKVGVGDSNIEVVDGDVAGMTLKGQSYQNILPKPTTLIMETDEKEFKINDKIDSNIIIDDNIAEIATVKGKTIVNTVQEESGSEYTVLGEDLSGKSIVTTNKPEGNIKGITLQGQTLVNTIQEPCKDDYVVLGADDGIEISAETGGHGTIEDTVQGGINGAVLEGNTLVNLIGECWFNGTSTSDATDKSNVTATTNVDKIWSSINFRVQKPLYKQNTDYIAMWDDIVGDDIPYKLVKAYDDASTALPNSQTGLQEQVTIYGGKNFIVFNTGDCTTSINIRIHFTNATASENQYTLAVKNMKVMEYQEGMENWDIPYFEGMKSVANNRAIKNMQPTCTYSESDGTYWCDTKTVNPTVGKQYFIKIFNNPNNIITRFYYGGVLVDTTTDYAIITATDSAVDRLHFYNLKKDTVTITEEQKNAIRFLICEYQDDMENWEINEHFEESYTAKMPVLTTSNEDGTKTNILTVNEEVELRRIGDIKDELDLTTGKLTQRIGEIVLDGSDDEGWRSTKFDYLTNNFTAYIPILNPLNTTDSAKMRTLVKDNKGFTNKCASATVNDKTMNGERGFSIHSNGNIYFTLPLTECADLTQWKQQLASQPLVVQYAIKPNIKTIDLQTTDQDGNTIPHIQTQPTVTHITASSDYLIPTVTIDNNLAYDTIIKPSTLYTIRFKHDTVNTDNPLTVDLGGTVQTVTSTEFTITTPSELTHNQLVFSGKNNVVSEVQVIEGDVVGTQYPFFEGMNDVKFSDSKFVGRGKNLLHVGKGYSTTNNYNGLTVIRNEVDQTITVDGTCTLDNTSCALAPFYREFKKGERYALSCKLISGTADKILFRVNDEQWKGNISCGVKATSSNIYETCIKTFYSDETYNRSSIRVDSGATFNNAVFKVMLEKIPVSGDYTPQYEPYKGVEVQQDVDSIPLTSDMFEQNGFNLDNYDATGFTMQQLNSWITPRRIKSKTMIKVKPNTKYIYNDSVVGYALFFDKNGLYIGRDTTYNLFTTTHDTQYVAMCLHSPQDLTTDTIITPSDLDSMNLILQEVPQEIVLRGIGDVKDELDLTRGEYIQRIGVIDDLSQIMASYFSPSYLVGNKCALLYDLKSSMPKMKRNLGATDFLPIYSLNFACTSTLSWGSNSGAWTNANQTQTQNIPTISTVNATYDFCVSIPNSLTGITSNDNTTTLVSEKFNKYIQSLDNFEIHYILATPIIHKVNLTNTKVIPSYATETHYETITPSDSLIPNIIIPSTLNYNVAIKPSTEYTIRANTSDNLTVDLGGTTGTLSNGKATLTTPGTLTHNEVKFSGTGKVKELMVVEGNEIKDNVPFFNGMKDVQMGGIKLVNIARGATCNNLVTTNTNKTQFTYTSDGTNWGDVLFDKSLLKQNTLYTIYINIISSNSDNANPLKISMGDDLNTWLNVSSTGLFKQTFTTNDNIGNLFGINFRPCTSGQKVVIENPMIIEGDWTHLDEIPFIESEMIIEQPIIRSQGKNLLDLESKPFTVASAGTTFTKSGSTYTITTTLANSTPYDYIRRVWTVNNDKWLRDVAGKKLTLSVSSISCTNSKSLACIQLRIECMDGTKYYPGIQNGGKAVTFNMPTNVKNLQMQIMTNNTGTALTEDAVLTISNIQLELGDTATPYEPYKHQTLYSNRVIGYEEGVHYVGTTGLKVTNENYNSVMADVEGLSIAYVTNGSSNFTFWNKDGVYISGESYLNTSLSKDNTNGFIQVPSNAKYMKFVSGNTTGSITHYTKATVTGELPLRSLPNGVCDTLNLVTGEYVQRVGEVILDGDEVMYLNTSYPPNNKELIRIDINEACNGLTQGDKPILCSHFPTTFIHGLAGGSTIIDHECISNQRNADNVINLIIKRSRLVSQDVAGLRAYLQSNPITVQYELATPIVRKLGFTTKGNYREQVLDGSETWDAQGTTGNTIRFSTQALLQSIQSTPLFTNDIHARKYPADAHGAYEYISNIEMSQYVNVKQDKLNSLDVNGCTQWLSQNPIKVGYITSAQSSESYSNIHKPIFFNDVDVQYLPNNVDIQPELTYQVRTRNSYVMDMMKPNTKYSVKLLLNTGEFVPTIDGVNNPLVNGRTFTSPSTLTNKLLITPCIKELMIIEGDVTSKNLPYFKGILSSYHDVDEIEVYSVNKNLFDMSKVKPYEERGTYWWNTIVKENEVVSVRIGDINNGQFGAYAKLNVRPNSVYTLYIEMEKDGEPFNGQIYGYENGDLWGNGTFTGYANTPYHINTSHNAKYITIGFNYGKDLPIGTTLVSKNMRLYLGEENPVYIPHAHSTTLIEMPTRLETVKVVRPIMENGAINTGTGASYDDGDALVRNVRTKDYLPVQPGEIIKFYNNGQGRAVNIHYYDINKQFIKYEFYDGTSTRPTVPKDCYFVRMYCGKSACSDITLTRQAYKPIQLNSLPNGVCDEIIMKPNSNKAQLVQRVGKVVLDGSEDWYQSKEYTDKYKSMVCYIRPSDVGANCYTITDKYVTRTSRAEDTVFNYFYVGSGNVNIVERPNVHFEEVKTMLQQNPIIVYYELATPIIHEIQLKGYPTVYKDGTVTLNTDTPHQTLVSYNVNQEQLINTQNEAIIRHDQQIDDLYYYIEMYLEEIYQMELFRMKLELSL